MRSNLIRVRPQCLLNLYIICIYMTYIIHVHVHTHALALVRLLSVHGNTTTSKTTIEIIRLGSICSWVSWAATQGQLIPMTDWAVTRKLPSVTISPGQASKTPWGFFPSLFYSIFGSPHSRITHLCVVNNAHTLVCANKTSVVARLSQPSDRCLQCGQQPECPRVFVGKY